MKGRSISHSVATDWLTMSVGSCVAILLATVVLVWYLVVRAYRKQKKVEHNKSEKEAVEKCQNSTDGVPLMGQGEFGFGVRDWQGFQNQVRKKREKLMKKHVEFAQNPSEKLNQPEVQPDNESDLIEEEEEDVNEKQTEAGNNQNADENDMEDEESSSFWRCFQTKKVEKAKKEIECTMTAEERQQEAEVRRQQLENIFKLMQEQEEKFGMTSVNDVQEQLKMYSL